MTEQSKWKRVALFSGAALFVLSLIVVFIGFLLSGSQSSKDAGKNAPSPGSSSSSGQGGSSGEEGPEEPVEFPAPVLDSSGLAEMAITTDPRVAAASAASVLMSVDTSKVEWPEDFRVESLQRVMRPSADYVGPGDQLQVRELDGTVRNGDSLIANSAEMLRSMEYSPTGWWWMLGDERNFKSFQAYGAKLISTPIEVFDQAEMSDFTGGVSWTEPSSAIDVNLNPGATFGLYWVRVETTTTTGDSETAARNPVALSIFCDPPEDGGVCGVIGLMTKYPTGWRTSF